jgi:hypothetical protein
MNNRTGMRKIGLLILIFITALVELKAQSVGINNPTPNATSILDITSTNKGLLVPRMTSAQRLAIVTPATGLLVYDLTLNLFYYFDGTAWRPFMIGNLDWLLAGNAGTNPGTQFIGTTDGVGLSFRTNNVEAMRIHSNGAIGLGISLPNASSILDMTSTTKGVLVPRMTSAQRTAIVTPATGLLVFDITGNIFYYWDGTQWVALQGSLGWSITGNSNTLASTNFLGTTNTQALVIKTNSIEAMRVLSTNQNVGIGQTLPASKLAVNGNTVIGAGYSNIGAPLNGLIVQGHTSVGNFAPLAADVFSSYSYSGENATAGYAAGSGFAAYFQNNSTGTVGRFLKTLGAAGSALQVHTNSPSNNANVLEIATNGTGNALNISDSGSVGKSIFINKISTVTTASIIEANNAGKGIGLYLKNINTTNTNPGIKVEQTRGEGLNVLMQSGNSNTGLYIYHNGTGIGESINMAPSNTNIGLQLNHAGIERGFDINLTNPANGNDAIKITHSGSGKGINVNVASVNSYAIWATNSTTVAAVSPGYSLGNPINYTSNFLPGVGTITAGPGHGIIANSVLDGLTTTDHDGGIFIVRQNNLSSTNVAAASVGAVLNNITYKVIGLGAVSTLVKDLNDDMRVMACPESPEVLFQDFGRGQLTNGKTHITIDPIFSKNITVDAKHPLNVLIQLRGDCKGVYVTNETATGFDVIELNGGTSNAEFTWFASGNRKNETIGGNESDYENMRFKKMDNPMFNQKNEERK